MDPSVASRIRDQPSGMTAVPALPFCPRSSIVMAAATIVTVVIPPLVVATVSVPLATGTRAVAGVWAANVVRSANVIRAGMANCRFRGGDLRGIAYDYQRFQIASWRQVMVKLAACVHMCRRCPEHRGYSHRFLIGCRRR